MTTADPAGSSRDLPHPVRAEIRLESVLHALSDPMRLRIVRELAAVGDELSCSHFDLPVTKSTTTHHFRVLRESGVIRVGSTGERPRTTPLRGADLDALFPGFLDSVLAAIERQGQRLGEPRRPGRPAGRPVGIRPRRPSVRRRTRPNPPSPQVVEEQVQDDRRQAPGADPAALITVWNESGNFA